MDVRENNIELMRQNFSDCNGSMTLGFQSDDKDDDLLGNQVNGHIEFNLSQSHKRWRRALFSCYCISFFASIQCAPRDAPVAQLDRVLDYESSGRGFESYLAHHDPIL